MPGLKGCTLNNVSASDTLREVSPRREDIPWMWTPLSPWSGQKQRKSCLLPRAFYPPSLRRHRQVDLCAFKVSLVYTVSSRLGPISKQEKEKARDMNHWSRVLAALPENQGSVSSTPTGWLTSTCYPSSTESSTLLWPSTVPEHIWQHTYKMYKVNTSSLLVNKGKKLS